MAQQTHRKQSKSVKSKPRSRPAPRRTAPAPSTALTIRAPQEKPWELNGEQLTILKNSIAKGATDEELKYCLTVSRRYKLDPFKQQIWFIKRWDKSADNGKGGTGAYLWTPQVGIYGMMHIAARDHADYGCTSKPEYGDVKDFVIDGHKLKAPEWCTVKLWKKGLSEPSVGEVWFEEYCPKSWDNVRLFWAIMPHRMIAKCAKAQAMREAYPDLGGLYIPEECERIQSDYTPSGRQIVTPDTTEPTHQRRLDENVPHGHAPGSEKARMAEAQLAKVEEEDRKFAEAKNVSPKQEPAVPKAQPAPPMQFKGTVEIDCITSPDSPIVRGDLSNIIDVLQRRFSDTLKWQGDWWHIAPSEVQALIELLAANSYKAEVKLPPKSSAGQQSLAMASPPAGTTKGRSEPTSSQAAPTVVSGTIERINSGMAGRSPVKQITLLQAGGKKLFLGCFHKSMWDDLEKGLGKLATFRIVTKGDYNNIEGLVRIGAKEWDEQGLPAVQNSGRIAGQKTLY